MITPPSIEHEVVSRLIKAGFSPETAAFYWAGIDRSGSVDDILERIMERVMIDRSADTCAAQETSTEGASQNGEEPYPFSPSGDTHRPQAEQASSKTPPRGNFDVPFEEAVQDEETEPDDEDEEPLNLDLSDADAQDLFDAASAELNHPKTLAQNRMLLSMLPEWLASLIREWMRFVKIPALLPTICALVNISAVLMKGLRCWSSKGWVYAHLYAVLGGRTGVGKSLVFDEAARPLNELDEELWSEFEDLLSSMRVDSGIIESTIKAKMSAHHAAVKGGEALSEAELQKFKTELSALHKEKARIEEQMKKEPSLWTSDFTSEALGTLLQDNGEQMSIHSDEGGTALFDIEGKYNEGGQTDDILLCKCFTGNGQKVNRISRRSVRLRNPRCSLLLLVQPDLLRRAFRNERLVVGGFLARAFSMDCNLKIQPELPGGQEPINADLTARWNAEIKALYRKFRCTREPYTVRVEPAAHERARRHRNAIALLVRGRLSDVEDFATRWTELTWRVALVIHAIRYSTKCDTVVLSGETYEGAASITRIFFLEQLKVLQMLRVDKQQHTHKRLQELFLERQNAPVTLRDLKRSHGLENEWVETCVKTYPDIYGLVNHKSVHGKRSTVLFLKAFPPPSV